MNLVWIFLVLATLAASIVLLFIIPIIILTRRWKWWTKITLLSLPVVATYFLWNIWEPHELKDPGDLAARFELVFQFPPAPMVTDIHYRLDHGPDDLGEWFRFQSEPSILQRLAPDLERVRRDEFVQLIGRGSPPPWWLPDDADNSACYRGNITTVPGTSPHYRSIWIAYDENRKVVYCYIHSLL